MCLIACIPPSPKSHIFCLFRAVFHNYLRCCLPGCNPYFASNINLTHISYFVHRSTSNKLYSCFPDLTTTKNLVCIFKVFFSGYKYWCIILEMWTYCYIFMASVVFDGKSSITHIILLLYLFYFFPFSFDSFKLLFRSLFCKTSLLCT